MIFSEDALRELQGAATNTWAQCRRLQEELEGLETAIRRVKEEEQREIRQLGGLLTAIHVDAPEWYPEGYRDRLQRSRR